MATHTKRPQGVRSDASQKIKIQENSNPNITSAGLKPSNSPSIKSANAQKSGAKTSNTSFVSPKKKIRERKFVVAKKTKGKKQDLDKDCKCKDKVNGKCLCVAYENLRASQEEFFKSRGGSEVGYDDFGLLGVDDVGQNCAEKLTENKPGCKNSGDGSECEINGEESEFGFRGSNEKGSCESPKGLRSATIKRRRDMLLEEARQSVPEAGAGRVLHLVKAFERLLTMPKESDNKDEKEKEMEDTNKGLKWALPGLKQPPATQTAFCPGELIFNADSLGLDAQVSSSLDLDSSRGSVSSRSSMGSQRSRRRSGSFSSEIVGGGKWKKKQQHKVTSSRPFRLRTEQRGKMKEEEFVKKLQEMMIKEEKQRIPIAQGLPWTTDEPECLKKPPIKEITQPIDLKLHSDVRAVERAEFDHQVFEKLTLIEQYKMEREMQQKLEEEEEIKRLRRELVPKAQPMPYFDRPFVPRRSVKQPTIPKEPRFQFPQQKKIKSSLSWSDFNEYIHAT